MALVQGVFQKAKPEKSPPFFITSKGWCARDKTTRNACLEESCEAFGPSDTMKRLCTAIELAAARMVVDSVGFLVLSFTPVFEGRMAGAVFGDGTRVLVANHYGMSLLCGPPPAGEGDEGVVEWLARHIQPNQRAWMEWLQVWPCAPWMVFLERLIVGAPFCSYEQGKTRRTDLALCERLNFTLAAVPDAITDNLPAELSLFEMSREHFGSILEGSVIPMHFWKDVEAWAEGRGAGFVIFEKERPVCWAFSSAVSASHLEIGIETVPEWRGRGLARAACFSLLSYCRSRGLEPVWCCRRPNEGSCRVAEALGFRKIVYDFGCIPYLHLPVGDAADAADFRCE